VLGYGVVVFPSCGTAIVPTSSAIVPQPRFSALSSSFDTIPLFPSPSHNPTAELPLNTLTPFISNKFRHVAVRASLGAAQSWRVHPKSM
jgi:hypothetical protein